MRGCATRPAVTTTTSPPHRDRRSVTEHPTFQTGPEQRPPPEAIANGPRPERDPFAPGAIVGHGHAAAIAIVLKV